jgi:uncharacterized membrane protein YcaP (DUF421 family)
MDYISILDKPPMDAIGLSVLQTAVIFIFVLGGLKAVGRRVFGEQSPQDLILLLVIAEACDIGLTPEDAGFWGTIASITTILFLGWLCDRLGFIRKAIDGEPVVVFSNGNLDKKVMKKFMIDEDDLDVTARLYGLESFKDFYIIIIEGDGKITGVLTKADNPAIRHQN